MNSSTLKSSIKSLVLLSNNWVRMNTDGSVRVGDAFAAVKGILRDHNGRWIIEFTRYLSNYWFWALGYYGRVKTRLDRRFERVLIQTDSFEAVNIIQDGDGKNSNSTLVRRIHSLLKLLSQWSIQHVPRKDNKITDTIVKTINDRRIELKSIDVKIIR